jgi:hypothetical protein
MCGGGGGGPGGGGGGFAAPSDFDLNPTGLGSGYLSNPLGVSKSPGPYDHIANLSNNMPGGMNPMGGTITGGNPNDPGIGIMSPGSIGAPGAQPGPALPPSSLPYPQQTGAWDKVKSALETGGKAAAVGGVVGSVIPAVGTLAGTVGGGIVGAGYEMLKDADFSNMQAPTGDPFGGFQGNQSPSYNIQPMRPIDQAQPPSLVPSPGQQPAQPAQPAFGQYANRLTGQALTPEEFANYLLRARY